MSDAVLHTPNVRTPGEALPRDAQNPAWARPRDSAAPAAAPPATPAVSPPQPLRRLASSSLLRGDAEIEIAHGPVVYRLRLTGLVKLILTK